ALEIWELHNVPAVARKLEPAGKHDACFLPRAAHVTGDVQIHEMAWVAPHPRPLAPVGRGENLAPLAPAAGARGGGEGEPGRLLPTPRSPARPRRARNYSFAPCWRPAFISALAPEDRCHLNGLGVRDGQVRYVTALGATDTPAGWRADKKSGGILL